MNKEDLFKKIFNEHNKYYIARETIVSQSRKALKLSKQAIFSLHRDDTKGAKEALEKVEKIFSELYSNFEGEDYLKYEGSYREAAEEYIEAKLFYNFIADGKIGTDENFGFSFMEYLGGISDLTGEILRKAVQKATKKDFKSVLKYQEAMEDIMEELIKFDLTGKNRSKYDAAKRNLKRMEEIVYETSLKSK